MKIGIIGYGKMGKTIATIAEARGHQIVDRIDIDNRESLAEWNANMVDAAIEFTAPSQAFENLKTCIERSIPVVSGTTGWLDRKSELDQICKQKEGTYFYASNFSLGVNITFKVNQYLARIMNSYQDFSVSMEEIHHMEKKDAPSGTAITLAEGILAVNDRLDSWTLTPGSEPRSLPITSVRQGTVPGTHTVKYRSEFDEITLKHQALSRQGFALGAVLVTEWIQNRKGILTMDDFLDL